MMNQLKSTLATLAFASVTISSASASTNDIYAGAMCTAKDAASQSRLEFNRFGVVNVSTTASATVGCGARSAGLTIDPPLVKQIVASVFDRSALGVCCTATVSDSSGNTLAAQTKCSDFLAADARESGMFFSFSSSGVRGFPYLECTIPPAVPGGAFSGFSAVAHYTVVTP